jgi:hypothetical protein
MRTAALATVLMLAPSYTNGQSLQTPAQIREQWRWYAESGDNLISDMRPKFRAVLDPEDRALESDIEYEIAISGNNNAFASPDGRTLLTAGFLQVIDSMATVMSAAQQFNRPACLGSYVDYLAKGTQSNSWLVAHHQPPQPVAMAFGYWQLNPDVCGGLSERVFRANKQADDLRESMIYASLIYLIGHEFCHHKYHDSTFKEVSANQKRLDASRGKDVSQEVTPAEQTVKEQRADLFAFHKMIEMDYPPIAAMPVLIFFAGFEGYSPEQSPEADHPAAVLRFNDMIDATARDAQFMKLIRERHMEQQWDQFVAFGKQLASPN